jgi:hypothetical protein
MKHVYNGKEFKSQQKILEYIRVMKDKYQIGECINKDDRDFLYAVLQKHHNATKKIGCGVDTFRKSLNIYNCEGFQIIRTDGTITDFSYIKCIMRKSRLQYVKEACRIAIEPDIVQFKRKFFANRFEAICPLTNKIMTMNNCHVDHAPPNTFNNIFNNWVKDRNINIDEVKIDGFEDNQQVKWFKDININNDFIAYHNSKAQLRITSPEGNIKYSKDFPYKKEKSIFDY